jgi:hypothetical protein
MHRREWYCSLHGPFSTSAKFQQHLLSDHSDLDSMAQSRVVVDRAERTIQSEQSCPMCGKEHLSPRGLRTHLGRHMQQVALFVLPGSVQEEDESGSVSSDSEVHRSQETVEALEVQAREPIRGTVQVLTVLFFQIRDVLETFRDVIRRLESYNEESENSISLGDFHGDISEALRELRMENALLETRIAYILSDLFPAKQVQALMSGEGWDELEIQADLNQSTQPGHANLLSKELLSLHSSLEEIVDLFKSEDYRKVCFRLVSPRHNFSL